MAQEHNQIHHGVDFLKGMSDAVGLGDEDGVIRLSETLTPVMDIWTQPEFAYPRKDRLCAHARIQAGVPAEVGVIALSNESVNLLVVLPRIRVRDTAGVTYQIQYMTQAAILGTLASFVPGAVRDRRWPSSPAGSFLQSQAVVRFGSDPSGGLGDVLDEFAGSQLIEDLEIVIPPGHGVAVVCQTVNIAYSAGFFWRERQMLPSERANSR